MIDAGRKQDIGNHIVAIQPMVFERMMDRYMKVTCQGGYFKTDKQEVKLQSVELDYFFLNSGTAAKPDWQAVGLLGESITHIFELTNAGKTGLSTAEEAALVLQTDEYFGA